jgi:hypothetical protein
MGSEGWSGLGEFFLTLTGFLGGFLIVVVVMVLFDDFIGGRRHW